MPIQLARYEDYTKLPAVTYSLAWICCECMTVNAPRHVDCDGCGKQRWLQLNISSRAAEKLAKEIK